MLWGAYRQQRTSTSTAPNQHGICLWDALPDFCLIAICRRTAQDWRGADDRPLDSRIKGQSALRPVVRYSRSLAHVTGLAAHCKNLSSPFRSRSQRNVRTAPTVDLTSWPTSQRCPAISAWQGRCRTNRRPSIGIGGSLATPPLPHHRTYGTVYGGSAGYASRAESRGRPRSSK